jgi:hypothetical protein
MTEKPLYIPIAPKNELICNYFGKKIADFIDNTLSPDPETLYKSGTVPVPNFGWFCSQKCALNYEKDYEVRFARGTNRKIDYYEKDIK